MGTYAGAGAKIAPMPPDEDRAWRVHLLPGASTDDVDMTAGGSLPAAWAGHWVAAPERRVLRDLDGTWWTRGDLDRASRVLAGRLAGAGCAPGDRLLLCGPTSAAFVAVHVAALRLGAVVVPVNPAYTAREIAVIVTDAAPVIAVVADEAQREAVLAAAPSTVVTGLEVALPEGAAPPLDRSLADDPALLPYTSGTTGTPKGALLSHGNLLASARAVALAWRWTADDRLVLALPLFHMHGLGVGLHGTLLAGGSAVLFERFDPVAVLDAIDHAGATMFFGVPTMYERLVEAPGADRLARLRLCVSGSAPMTAALHERVRRACGQVALERYGMTETVMLVSNPFDGERRPGSVGLPLPGVSVRLADTSGEIEVTGPNVFSGYWRRPDAAAASFTADGWFRTGDVGTFDADGYLRIVGRTKELIITGGFNVYPREVEDVLRRHDRVTDVAVIGTPSEEWGEVVTAFVEAPADLPIGELAALAAGDLAAYKRPRVVHLVDALPRNALGKVVRHELRDDGHGIPVRYEH